VKGVIEDDDGLPAGGNTRDLDRILDRLRARVDEDAPLLAGRTGGELGEPAADLDVRLVRADHEALVQVPVDLLVDRGDGGGEVVAGVLAADTSGEVDVAATVDVPEPAAVGPVDDDGRDGNAPCDVARASLENALAFGAVLDRHRHGDITRPYAESLRVR
jgi:hypothetical protein